MSSEIALFCLLHPGSAEKKTRILSLLQNSLPYYHSQPAQCSTWCYFTPSTRPGAANQIANTSGPNSKSTMIAGLEIYTSKSALSTQLEDPTFQAYHAAVKAEDLYAKPEELVAWYPEAGFVAREAVAGPFGGGNIVMVAKFLCREGGRDKVLGGLSPFAEWVKHNEPDVMTYCILIRPKVPREILIFERYRNPAALKSHGGSKEFRAMFKQIKPFLEVEKTVLNEWEELDGSFVGNVIGGSDGMQLRSGAASKL